jgi:hypothetical protein
MLGLERLKQVEIEAAHRGKDRTALMPFWERKRHA